MASLKPNKGWSTCIAKQQSFREDDYLTFLYDGISRATAEQLLQNEEPGTFFLRSSEHYPGSVVLCVRDTQGPVQCIIHFTSGSLGLTECFIAGREEIKFNSIPDLLAFYKLHQLVNKNLTKAIPWERMPTEPRALPRRKRITRPPSEHSLSSAESRSPRHSVEYKFVRCKKAHTPSAYSEDELALEVDDLIRVTKESACGMWEGVIIYPVSRAGSGGDFPVTHIELLPNFFQFQYDSASVRISVDSSNCD